MEVTWLRRPAFMVMGTVTRISENEGSAIIEEIWRHFESHHEQIMPLSVDRAYYGVRFPTEEGRGFDYQAGMAVTKAHTTPAGLMVREIPSARYAVFRCLPKEVENTYRSILNQWLPESGQSREPAIPLFEQYPPEGASDPYVLVHMPIQD